MGYRSLHHTSTNFIHYKNTYVTCTEQTPGDCTSHSKHFIQTSSTYAQSRTPSLSHSLAPLYVENRGDDDYQEPRSFIVVSLARLYSMKNDDESFYVCACVCTTHARAHGCSLDLPACLRRRHVPQSLKLNSRCTRSTETRAGLHLRSRDEPRVHSEWAPYLISARLRRLFSLICACVSILIARGGSRVLLARRVYS